MGESISEKMARPEQAIPEGDESSERSGDDALDWAEGSKSTEDEVAGKEEVVLARAETRAVRFWRVVTFIVLVIVAVLASLGVYYYTVEDQANAFRVSFESNGNKVIRSFQDDADRKLQALYSLSSTLTTYSHKSTWPFVTVDESANVLEPYLTLADAAAIVVLPIVPSTQRAEWEVYSTDNQGWVAEDLLVREQAAGEELKGGERRRTSSSSPTLTEKVRSLQNQSIVTDSAVVEPVETTEPVDNTELVNNNVVSSYKIGGDFISPYIQNYVGIDTSPGRWVVWWQYAPVLANRWYVNFNCRAWTDFDAETAPVIDEQKAVVSQSFTVVPGLDEQSTRDYEFWNELLQARGAERYDAGEPLSFMYYPIVQNHNAKNKTVALLSATVYWKSYFEDILTSDIRGVVAVVQNSRGQAFSYQLDGKQATFLGLEDLHDANFDDMRLSADYSSSLSAASAFGNYGGVPLDESYISYSIHVYPSVEMQAIYQSNDPIVYTAAILVLFVITAAIFILYDCMVERRQKKVYTTAVKSTAVVDSLFPKNVRDRLMDEHDVKNSAPGKARDRDQSLRMSDQSESSAAAPALPIADFFPATTIMFADIKGFTAWCSTREPAQVFSLLETIYNSFDTIAKRRRVFKVETVGDCYMAATGLPDPRKDHAVAMVRFAKDCLLTFNSLVRELETTLGPDTADLALRCGLHSGAVTGGVIRGDNVRFQLFGDTVNTASRMESTGMANRIQFSQDTANLLEAAGKSSWFEPREDEVVAKGKGKMKTYFLKVREQRSSSGSVHSQSSDEESEWDTTEVSTNYDGEFPLVGKKTVVISPKKLRLIKWNVDLLTTLLKQVVAHREASSVPKLTKKAFYTMEQKLSDFSYRRAIDEVEEIIKLPCDDRAVDQENAGSIELLPVVLSQLHDYVRNIAAMYQDNPFHNFEHASHVTMSVQKLLSRIIAPRASAISDDKTMHDHTYGITSDPLTQFACVLAALIHDADHSGVPNAQLVKEKTRIAEFYNDRSVAEQNSVDLAWNLLMMDDYNELRSTIYGTEAEMFRFRQLVVSAVMATDIVDSDLKTIRNKRWERAFATSSDEEAPQTVVNRKATIVIAHLIQASDVAHTMQHWHVYRKWNEQFFFECYKAFKQGRAETDPSENWYKGEIGFFDFYIIPLAKKLKECGVFGVSSDEYLTYALNNRNEWESRGMEVVSEMKEKVLKKDWNNTDNNKASLLEVGEVGYAAWPVDC